jgi:hypothetical protein
MTTTRSNRNTTVKAEDTAEASPAELEVVDLDPPTPPDPAIARWEALTGEVDIYHGGDASKVLGMPRPSWCDPDEDFTGSRVDDFGYGSAIARVVVSSAAGVGDDESLVPARVTVQAVMGTTNSIRCGIQICLARATGTDKSRPWINSKMNLTPAEALELADVLRAAVGLIGIEK